MRLIDEVIGYAKANAEAPGGPYEAETWAAHHRNCIEIRKQHDAEIERLRAELVGLRGDKVRALCQVSRLRTAIYWALGEAPDKPSGGWWFGEVPHDEVNRPFWWRSHLRKISGVDEQNAGKETMK